MKNCGRELKQQFLRDGWCRFGYDPALAEWVSCALPAARKAILNPDNDQWWRCQRTWFVGVNALANDGEGAIGDGPALQGSAVSFIQQNLGYEDFLWDQAQISVIYPDYPRHDAEESASAYRYRQVRDAAHVDGLRRQGPQRRRFVDEFHGFLLGVPLSVSNQAASPLVVWQGSHHLVRKAFQSALGSVPVAEWRHHDVTEIYKAVRQEIFASCPRVIVHGLPGEAYLLHRLSLHGVAAWGADGNAPEDGRIIAYFRPAIVDGEGWLNRP